MNIKKYFLSSLLVMCLHFVVNAQAVSVHSPYDSIMTQPSSPVVVSDTNAPKYLFVITEIALSGDRVTKPYIIYREIPFKTGDSISLPDLVSKFDLARRQLMNTRLFNDVVVSLKGFKGYEVEIQVEVKERWYLFPIPYFKIVDRNLSEWAKQGYRLNRVNYGAKFTYYNFTGRNDKLKAWLITGYTRQAELSYEQPNADKSLKHGYGVNVSYATAKEVNHITRDNEQKFFPIQRPETPIDSMSGGLFHGQVLNEQFNLQLSYTYRPAIKTRHTVRLNYNINRIDEAIAIINPRYFNNGKLRVAYPELSYTIDYNNIDYVAYPLKGVLGEVSLLRRGINKDMDMWQLSVKGTFGWQIAKKTYYGLQAYGLLKLPFDQPYFNQRALGYGDLFLRGLEKYVIDGVGIGMIRNTFRRELFKFNIPLSLSKSHDKIPFRVFIKTYGDMGYAYNKTFLENSLANRMLYTAGAGIDLLTYYDFAFRFEYSCNQLGQKGLFLHFKNDF